MKLVLSASRRTDLVAFHPDVLLKALRRYPPEKVHTVVLWTKDPRNLLRGRVGRVLSAYSQLFVHYTITGMGGTTLEPGVISTREALRFLPELVDLVGDPRRVRVRFDPVVNFYIEGRYYTNLPLYEEVAEEAARWKVPALTTSWVQFYPKVLRRLARNNITPAPFDLGSQWGWMKEVSQRYGLELYACCVEGLPTSRCIDGELLSKLHPEGEPAPLKKAEGQRPLCGCTTSVDLGWYTQRCPGGCLYCYANPLERTGCRSSRMS